jgi:CubicO group peptidase (beta-lactamase class C family)
MATTDEAIGAVFSRWARRTRAPGVAWGVVRRGELTASGGVGVLQLGDDSAPDEDTIFRIASMTKSFTGAALMTLVADGRLRLDDPVSTYLPQLAGWTFPSGDGPPITVRHLVSMEAGLPTDDAWADRHVDLTDDQMDALLEAGGAFAWTPGSRFEYSNLGWGLVGRIALASSTRSATPVMSQPSRCVPDHCGWESWLHRFSTPSCLTRTMSVFTSGKTVSFAQAQRHVFESFE